MEGFCRKNGEAQAACNMTKAQECLKRKRMLFLFCGPKPLLPKIADYFPLP